MITSKYFVSHLYAVVFGRMQQNVPLYKSGPPILLTTIDIIHDVAGLISKNTFQSASL